MVFGFSSLFKKLQRGKMKAAVWDLGFLLYLKDILYMDQHDSSK